MSQAIEEEDSFVTDEGPVTVPITDAGGGLDSGAQSGEDDEGSERDAARTDDESGGGDDGSADESGDDGTVEPDAGGGSSGDDGAVVVDAGGDEGGGDDDGNQTPMCTPSQCDDGIACTVDGCGANDRCIHVPDNSLCANGGTCSATQGCQAPACGEDPCKLVSPQCGCAAGQGCYPNDFTLEPECAPAGTSPEGEPCGDNRDCAAGTVCLGASIDPGTSACTKLCNTNADCTMAGTRCTGFNDGWGDPTGLKACY